MKSFMYTLLIGQNKWHNHSVLVHTLKVMYGTIKYNRLDLFSTALLHDIGKPFVAYKDSKDLKQPYESYSFTNHEEKSYEMIKNIPFISERTKLLVRYHYLLRGISKLKEKGNILQAKNNQKIWDLLDKKMQNDLIIFQEIDDYGKK